MLLLLLLFSLLGWSAPLPKRQDDDHHGVVFLARGCVFFSVWFVAVILSLPVPPSLPLLPLSSSVGYPYLCLPLFLLVFFSCREGGDTHMSSTPLSLSLSLVSSPPCSWHSFYKDPVMLVDGDMQYMYDEQGKRYLDLFAGIVTVSVGHCHPKVTAAGLEQMKKLWHSTTIYYNNEVVEYAKELAERMPGDLSVCYFVNSGSEANDLALLMARLHTGNHDILTVRNAYHGMSTQQMGVTALRTWRYPVPLDGGIKHALNPDTFRGPYKADDPDAAAKYAWDVENIIDHTTPGQVAGWIAETIQGVGGTVRHRFPLVFVLLCDCMFCCF